jgi:hydrogenase expression/formation protein HypC
MNQRRKAVAGDESDDNWSKAMCLGIPMEVMAVNGFRARCSAQGIEREVSLFLLQDELIASGDFVLVHVGYAIQKMTPRQARSTWELLDEALAAEEATRNA